MLKWSILILSLFHFTIALAKDADSLNNGKIVVKVERIAFGKNAAIENAQRYYMEVQIGDHIFTSKVQSINHPETIGSDKDAVVEVDMSLLHSEAEKFKQTTIEKETEKLSQLNQNYIDYVQSHPAPAEGRPTKEEEKLIQMREEMTKTRERINEYKATPALDMLEIKICMMEDENLMITALEGFAAFVNYFSPASLRERNVNDHIDCKFISASELIKKGNIDFNGAWEGDAIFSTIKYVNESQRNDALEVEKVESENKNQNSGSKKE